MSIFQEDKIKAVEPGRKSCQSVTVGWTPERQAFFERKYWFDLWFGRLLLVLFSPLILALWVLVFCTSKGSGFYRQKRTGLNGQDFYVIKLRSMTWDAEDNGKPVLCCKKDGRMTILGKVLRLLHLDELPQLVNVARGEMVLVGPRPERPVICEELAKRIENYSDRVLVKPGITGLSQINLPPDSTWGDVRRKQALDLTYINEVDMLLELRILIATSMRMFGIKGGRAMRAMALSRNKTLHDLGLKEQPNEEPLPFSQEFKAIEQSQQEKSQQVKLQEPRERCDFSAPIGVESRPAPLPNP